MAEMDGDWMTGVMHDVSSSPSPISASALVLARVQHLFHAQAAAGELLGQKRGRRHDQVHFRGDGVFVAAHGPAGKAAVELGKIVHGVEEAGRRPQFVERRQGQGAGPADAQDQRPAGGILLDLPATPCRHSSRRFSHGPAATARSAGPARPSTRTRGSSGVPWSCTPAEAAQVLPLRQAARIRFTHNTDSTPHSSQARTMKCGRWA